MGRSWIRLFVASWTLVAVLATGVSPLLRAAEGMGGAGDDHACCPERMSEAATHAGVPTSAPPPCCALGGTSAPVPTNVPPTTTVNAASKTISVVAWEQPVVQPRPPSPLSTRSLDPVSPLVRSSILLI